MAKITSHRALRFEHEGKQHHVSPSAHEQHVPDWVAQHDYFKAAEKSGWLVVHEAPKESEEDGKPKVKAKGKGKKSKPEDSGDGLDHTEGEESDEDSKE
jgi:hypothetical protein